MKQILRPAKAWKRKLFSGVLDGLSGITLAEIQDRLKYIKKTD